MVYFVGAGTGAADLITVRGMRLLEQADVIIYAGSLVNPELLAYAKKECEIFNSATMTLVRGACRDAAVTGGRKNARTVCTPETQAFMVRSGNRWMNWTGLVYHMKAVRVSVPALERQHP